MKRAIRQFLFLLTLGLAASLQVTLEAQVTTATISGLVKDQQNSVIAGAQVTATAKKTGFQSNAVSDASGYYNLPFLQPGAYDITVFASGFAKYDSNNLALSSGDHPTIDVTLRPGGAEETVVVTSEVPLLGTADANLGSVVQSVQVEALPLNGRTPMVLAQYTAGVVSTTTPGSVHAYDNSTVSAFSVGGLPNKNSELLLDGAPDNASDNAIAYSPMQDAVAEVKVNIFATDSEYGHAGGGVVNQTSKGGSNDLHGSAWEFDQNTIFNANTWLAGRSTPTTAKSPTHYNQYGLTVGGPVIIPHVVHGKDKLFWLFGWENIKNIAPATFSGSVPTSDERAGNFSEWLNLGSKYQIYNPYSTTVSGSTVTRAPYSGNIITNSLSSVSQAILKLYPSPNTAPTTGTVDQNNYFSQNSSVNTFKNFFVRVDYQLNSNQRLFVTWRRNHLAQNQNNVFSNEALGDILDRVNDGATISDTISISPTTIAEVRLNYTRYVQSQDTASKGFDSTNLGFGANLNTSSGSPRLPNIRFADMQGVGYNITSGTLGDAPFNNYDILADVVKLKGSHTFKAGLDLRRYEKGNNYPATCSDSSGNATICSNGYFYFDQTWTKKTNTTTTTADGMDFAAFMLGLPSQASYAQTTSPVGEQYYMAYFAQDDWRVRSDLTINLGLRFEKDFAAYERDGRTLNGFNMTTANPISASALSAYASAPLSIMSESNFYVNGGPTFASTSNRSIYSNPSRMFSPRIGFSYNPAWLGQSNVIRGGFGIYVLPVYAFTNSINNPGYSQTTSATITNDNYATPATTLATAFSGGFVTPSGSANGLSTNLGQAVTYMSPVIKSGYAQRWTLGMQHQFPHNYLMELVYIGNQSARLPISYQPNYIRSNFLTTTSNTTYNGSVTNPFKGLIPNSSSMNGSTIAEKQLLMTFPEFGTLTEQNAPYGNSSYNAIDIRVEKRLGKEGLTLNANYQYSKLMEHASWLNNFQAPEHRISSYDHPHHTVTALTYELPYGHGKKFGKNASKILDMPLGGWKFNGVYTYQSGAPITWSDAGYNCNTYSFKFNPRNVASKSFDTSCFTTSSTPSNHIRTFPSNFTTFRYDAINNFDTSINKAIKFSGDRAFELRAESFNTLNRPQFSAPNITPTSSAFGMVTSVANTSRVIQIGGRLVF
ncbi:carboxypeptidase regulatory-like domain-containing protein [Telmatobacter bradus]|uniref:carboxypeptidase regulatory-like domain-containing protein n=1 Tax=Telmatobacter bradus TaxID=474953 RepID=UPI003B4332A2